MANPIYNTQSVTSFKGYINHDITELKKGKNISITKSYSGGQALLFNLKPSSSINLNAIKKLQLLYNKKTITLNDYRDGLKSAKIDLKEKTDFEVTAGNIMKSGEKIPFGYLAETILQAAIVAKFTTKRDGNVNVADVVKFLKDFIKNKSNSQVEGILLGARSTVSKAINKAFSYEGVNKNKKISNDNVYVYYSLNDGAFRWLENKISSSTVAAELSPYFNDAIRYVNSNSCKTHAEYFFTNNRRDRIDITSLGILGQGETKADLLVQYYEGYTGAAGSGKKSKLNLNLSVKINHIDQVGQITGIDSKTFYRLTEHFGVPLTQSQKTEIDNNASELLKNTKILKSPKKQGMIYDIVFTQLKKASNVGITRLLKGIEFFIAFNPSEAKSLTVVDIGSGLRTYFIKNLQNVSDSFKGKKIDAQVTTGGGAGVTKQVKYLIDGEVLFSINSRYTGGTYRNFINTGPLLREILEKA